MTKPEQAADPLASRRDFLKTSTAVAMGSAFATLGAVPAVHAAGSDSIRVGIIGCGGRGTGAAENVLQAAKGVEIVALGDYFQDRVASSAKRIVRFAQQDEKVKELGNKAESPAVFSGLDAYKKVIDAGVNYVILASSPGFRPQQLQAAVAAGKHIFTEKPVAVDGPGIRQCLEAYEQARAKGLGIGAGTQRRHQAPYIETIKQVQNGAIGDIVAARCYWNGGNIWFRPRRQGMTDLDYQVHNWYHFVWLCGDHIVEQHVHNLDVINWATGQHPIRALGMGGRVREYKDPNIDGNIYNYFAVEYEYPSGMHMQSMCRQVSGSDGNFPGIPGVSEALVGTKGTCNTHDRRHPNAYLINGKPAVSEDVARKYTDPYVQEHTNLIESIRAGKPLNELKNVTESTLTAIMGRMSAYTGKVVTWEQALNSRQSTMPENLAATSLPVPPLAVPGRTELL
jgi:predicted dehydrogenase